MKKQVTILEVGKCYRVKYENISWCIRIYEKIVITENLTLLSAIEVGYTSINMRSYISANIYQQNENSKYEVQEISNSEFMHEFRSKRNEINKLIRKISN
ncbi:hypothetical protein Coch_0874 [Capnocytophaga ochracea DSM 7271]|uniref:Uncharacterized protein n=1 Tax=Capnocytophaga ochracea (strain ATCC 27872 / DSM 7271 / CCUG 9716 / JCM 12966 / NCTC 12371 / SS31 / VPI 2845) TaxID=521097 RepID=C7M983_CAPOD|nr:hypothetical protein [Capnocytophaga ochracea]ACU92429.1 hypothetical protein Coch_0874 [Capnocytophaga ochracea DSM 7271]UAK51169.1 hypothetical protein K8O87_10520 [Capnocytophaga ochracea]